MRFLITLSIFLFALKSFSANQSPCASANLSAAAPGFSCVTSKGITFVRYKNPTTGQLGWLDKGSQGEIWYDAKVGNLTQAEAANVCLNNNELFPSSNDFAIADQHGIGEIFQDVDTERFWTSEKAIPDPTRGLVHDHFGYPALPVNCKQANLYVRCINEVVRSCARTDEQNAKVGTVCTTSVGDQFMRYKDARTGSLGWRDLAPNGRVWYDAVKFKLNQDQAQQFCESTGKVLPTIDDIERSDEHGIFEVYKFAGVPGAWDTGRELWTSDRNDSSPSLLGSATEIDPNVGILYDAGDHGYDYEAHTWSSWYSAAQCLAPENRYTVGMAVYVNTLAQAESWYNFVGVIESVIDKTHVKVRWTKESGQSTSLASSPMPVSSLYVKSNCDRYSNAICSGATVNDCGVVGVVGAVYGDDKDRHVVEYSSTQRDGLQYVNSQDLHQEADGIWYHYCEQ